MNHPQHFLHNTKTGTTLCFQKNHKGEVIVYYQHTLDPNEELNDDTFTVEEARKEWKKYIAEGYRKATGWHTCKRDSAWANNGDEYGDD
jgi:hypothetical protein